MIKKILMGVALAALTIFQAQAIELTPPEKAAPTVECHYAPEPDGTGWCYVKFRFPDGSLVSSAVYIKNGKTNGATRMLEGPRVVGQVTAR